MATIFSREEKAEALFGEILKNPEACLFFSWKYRCHQKTLFLFISSYLL